MGPGVRRALRRRGVPLRRVLWFEREPASRLPEMAPATVSTPRPAHRAGGCGTARHGPTVSAPGWSPNREPMMPSGRRLGARSVAIAGRPAGERGGAVYRDRARPQPAPAGGPSTMPAWSRDGPTCRDHQRPAKLVDPAAVHRAEELQRRLTFPLAPSRLRSSARAIAEPGCAREVVRPGSVVRPRGTRTPDTQFRKLVLYPLSYSRTGTESRVWPGAGTQTGCGVLRPPRRPLFRRPAAGCPDVVQGFHALLGWSGP